MDSQLQQESCSEMQDAAVQQLTSVAVQALTRFCAVSVSAAFARPLTAVRPPSLQHPATLTPTPPPASVVSGSSDDG